MKSTHKILLLIVIVALLGLACGLGGAVTDKVDEAKEAVAAEAEKAIEDAAGQLEEAAAEAQKAAEGAAEEIKATAEVAAEDVQAAVEEGADEEVSVEFNSIDETLNNFSSYKNVIKMTFSGTDADGASGEGSVEMYSEYIKDPRATHVVMNMSGGAFNDPEMEAMGNFEMEIYVVDGITYMRNPMMGEMTGDESPWISYAGGEDDMSETFFSSDDIIDIPDTARRSLLPQDVNGISCWHYTFDEKDIGQAGADIESAKGEMWVARDGGYPVKFIMEGIGISSADPSAGADFMNGNFKMEYELMSINEKFDIVVPEEALNAGGGFFGGDSSGQETDLPMVDDAVVDFAMEGMVSYTSGKTVDEVVAFYRNELPALGWLADTSFEMVDETSALLSFTKDGADLTLSVSAEEDGGITVALFTGE